MYGSTGGYGGFSIFWVVVVFVGPIAGVILNGGLPDASTSARDMPPIVFFGGGLAGFLLVGTRGAPSKFEVAMLKSPAVYGMTAVTKDQEALEVGGHGIFTKLLVDGLNGKVGVFARRERGHVTATELFSYVQRGVLEAAGKKGREQTPKFEPLWQMHKGRSCDGQVLFFKEEGSAAGSAATGLGNVAPSNSQFDLPLPAGVDLEAKADERTVLGNRRDGGLTATQGSPKSKRKIYPWERGADYEFTGKILDLALGSRARSVLFTNEFLLAMRRLFRLLFELLLQTLNV